MRPRTRNRFFLCVCVYIFGMTAANAHAQSATDVLSNILETFVFDVGRSEHKHAYNSNDGIGTRISFGNKESSWLEGNRVFFHDMSRDDVFEISHARRLFTEEALVRPVHNRKPDERLTYWLNLHNVLVLEELAHRYPVRSVRKLIFGETWQVKKVTVDGEDLSIADIETKIFAFNNPLVMYGLYMGVVGTPNIRGEAFRSDSVWFQLEANAIEFINSIRAVQTWPGYVSVSSFYKYAAALFPNLEEDVRTHILKYLEKKTFRVPLQETDDLRLTVKNWGIADLYNGHIGSNPAAFLSFTPRNGVTSIVTPNTAPHVNALLQAWVRRIKRQKPRVTVEELANRADLIEQSNQ